MGIIPSTWILELLHFMVCTCPWAFPCLLSLLLHWNLWLCLAFNDEFIVWWRQLTNFIYRFGFIMMKNLTNMLVKWRKWMKKKIAMPGMMRFFTCLVDWIFELVLIVNAWLMVLSFYIVFYWIVILSNQVYVLYLVKHF